MQDALQVVFSEVRWVGKKEDNPDEEELPIPQSVIDAGMKAAGAGPGSEQCLASSIPSCNGTVMKNGPSGNLCFACFAETEEGGGANREHAGTAKAGNLHCSFKALRVQYLV